MAATYTEEWSKSTLVKTPDGWRAVRSFDVVGAANETDAYTATAESGGAALPSLNDAHPRNSRLKVSSITPTATGPRSFNITVEYTIPDDGNEHEGRGTAEDGNDPLLRPSRVRWGEVTTQPQIDRDYADRPITNSARTPLETLPTKRVTFWELTITRTEPWFDFAVATTYRNKLNSAVLQVANSQISFPRLTALCVSILPTQEYTPDATAIDIAYRFWINPDGFDFRHLDQGRYVWLSGQSKPQPVRDRFSDVGTSPVLLNGGGGLYGTGDGIGTPSGATEDDTGSASFLSWQVYDMEDLNALNL